MYSFAITIFLRAIFVLGSVIKGPRTIPTEALLYQMKEDCPIRHSHIASSHHKMLDAFFRGFQKKPTYPSARATCQGEAQKIKQTETKVVRCNGAKGKQKPLNQKTSKNSRTWEKNTTIHRRLGVRPKTGWFRIEDLLILLMEEILHQLIGSLSRFLRCFMMFFMHPGGVVQDFFHQQYPRQSSISTKKTLSRTFFILE